MKNTENHTSETLILNPYELEVISNTSLTLEAETTETPNIIYGRTLSGKPISKIGLKNLFESLWQNKTGVNLKIIWRVFLLYLLNHKQLRIGW